MKKKKKVKLQKSLSPLNVWALALGSIIGWGCFVLPGNLFLETAGPLGTAIGMGIGAIIMIMIVGNYAYMVKESPVAGGEFAFALQGFGRNHAFICAWFLGLSYLSIVPLNATALGLIGKYLFPGVLQKGLLYTVEGWEVYAGEIIVAYIVLIVFAFASIRGIKIAGWLQTGMVFALVGAVILLGVITLFHSSARPENLLPLFSPEMPPLKGILTIVAIAPWVYVGFDCIPQAAEEFNFSHKKTFKIMVLSILFGTFMYIIVNTITAIAFPWHEFISTEPVWATGQVTEFLMGKIGLFILGISLLTAIFAGIIGFYMAASRLLLSLARAKALPAWFGKIHPIYKTPTNATIFVLVVSMLAPLFGRQVLLWVVDMASVGAAIGYFYTSASTFRLLQKKKGKIGLKINSFLSSLLSIGFILLLVIPGMPAYLTLPSRIALFVWIIIGIGFFIFTSKEYRSIPYENLEKLVLKKEK